MKKFFLFIITLTGAWFLRDTISWSGFWHTQATWMPEGYEKPSQVILDDDGRVFETVTRARTIHDFVSENAVAVGDDDFVSGLPDERLYEGKKVIIRRLKHVTLTVGGEKRAVSTYQTDRDRVLAENGIGLGEDDFVLPKNEGAVNDGSAMTVVRVSAQEQVVDKPIVFQKTIEEDPDLSWRKTVVKQTGENGVKRFTYRVLSHDGKEVDRKLLKQEIIKDPVTEKTVQGTYVAVGKAHTGLGTWYAYTGTMAAASPWLPMGSYVKVTNKDNGKTVIVKINDRGPFGKNRIIDLDKVAFAKIASIGAGIINVKVEEITN